MRLKNILLLGALTTATACGGSSTGPVVPTPVPDAPVLSCPADVSAIAHNGQAPTVTYDAPVVQFGAPPVTVACTPASGTQFNNGTTVVSCVTTDALSRRASCFFSVVVTSIPQLLKTRFMAFGDSLTEGKTSLTAEGTVVVPPNVFNTSVSYVEQLNRKLTDRYQDQAITVIAEGRGGELAGEGKVRLTGELASYAPDALLLLEGLNDLLQPGTATAAGMQAAINSVTAALQNMIQQGKGRGARVFVATLLPLNKDANLTAGVNTLNTRIRALAIQENVPLADLNAVVPLNLIGADGIHPKAQAYDLVADEWLNAIVATMEIERSALP